MIRLCVIIFILFSLGFSQKINLNFATNEELLSMETVLGIHSKPDRERLFSSIHRDFVFSKTQFAFF